MTTPVYLMALASEQSQWLSARQKVISGNIANANTPGYAASDIQPFSDVLAKTAISMTTTNPGHMVPDDTATASTKSSSADTWETYYSGNSVSLEQEMMKEGDINRSFSLNSNIKRAFHQMMMMGAK